MKNMKILPKIWIRSGPINKIKTLKIKTSLFDFKIN